MISMRLSTAAAATDAICLGEDVEFRGCSTDSRSIKTGEMFIAIKGERFDGHDFLAIAKQNGAVAAMLEKAGQESLPALLVSDTRRALGKLAQSWRAGFGIPLIAVTGSNGKTTVKEMLTTILRLKAPVLATIGNLNNDIGVPLTLFGLENEHRYAVIEMGANHLGEIAWLTEIARPTVAVITQCAPAHLEGFGSIEGVAQAKAEIYAGLDKAGVAVINADDDYAGFWRNRITGITQLSFGLNKPADVTARPLPVSLSTGRNHFVLKSPAGSVPVELSLLGEHNVMNALAAAACATALGVDLQAIKQGLELMRPVKGRLETKTGPRKSRLIDDTYNANPASLQAAIKAITVFHGRHWLVLGDMGELGPESENLHAGAGRMAREQGIERLYAIGTLSRRAVESFGAGGRYFSSRDELVDELRKEISADVTFLIKGSRAMQMEEVVKHLEERGGC